jgi:hypothetical protein
MCKRFSTKTVIILFTLVCWVVSSKMVLNSLQNGDATDEDEIDPLDASLNSMVIPIITKLTTDVSVLDKKSSDLMKDDKVQ